MNKKAWALALTVGLLGAGSAAQAALTAETLGGVDVVCDDDYTPVGASSPGLIWTADANLFKTQYDADNTVVARSSPRCRPSPAATARTPWLLVTSTPPTAV